MTNEKRRAPRFSHYLEVDIGGSELYTTNLSMTGTQLTCHPMAMFGLRPKLKQETIDLRLLPTDLPVIPIQARIVYMTEDDDEVLIGVEFVKFGETHEHVFRHYVKAVAGEDFVNYYLNP